jgi:hypothetical protein
VKAANTPAEWQKPACAEGPASSGGELRMIPAAGESAEAAICHRRLSSPAPLLIIDGAVMASIIVCNSTRGYVESTESPPVGGLGRQSGLYLDWLFGFARVTPFAGRGHQRGKIDFDARHNPRSSRSAFVAATNLKRTANLPPHYQENGWGEW